MTVHVSGDFDVDIYVDINGQWASGDREVDIVWEFGRQELPRGKALKTWKIRRQTEWLLSEIRDRAEWGTLHFSAPSVTALSLHSGIHTLIIRRMSGMSVVRRACCARDSLAQVLFKTLLMTIFAG